LHYHHLPDTRTTSGKAFSESSAHTNGTPDSNTSSEFGTPRPASGGALLQRSLSQRGITKAVLQRRLSEQGRIVSFGSVRQKEATPAQPGNASLRKNLSKGKALPKGNDPKKVLKKPQDDMMPEALVPAARSRDNDEVKFVEPPALSNPGADPTLDHSDHRFSRLASTDSTRFSRPASAESTSQPKNKGGKPKSLFVRLLSS
jgi:hypothetical protein